MRIAHVNDIAYVATELARAQRRQGLDVTIFDPGKPGGLLPYPLKTLTWPLRAPSLGGLALRLRRGRFDVVHIHYATYGILGLTSRAPFVLHCHGSDVRGVGPDSLTGSYLARIMRRASDVLYSTPDLETWMKPLRPDARLVPNPIDVERFSPGAADRDVLIGTRLHPIKGAETAIDAVAELRRRRPDTTVTMIADGPLTGYATERLGGNILVLGPQPHDAMPALLRRHRVTLGQFHLGILSQYELEAMACGIPVVADYRFPAAYPSAPPVLEAASVGDIVKALERILDDPGLRSATATRSRDWVVAEHAADQVARRVSEIYADAIGPSRAERASKPASTRNSA